MSAAVGLTVFAVAAGCVAAPVLTLGASAPRKGRVPDRTRRWTERIAVLTPAGDRESPNAGSAQTRLKTRDGGGSAETPWWCEL